MNPAAAGPPPRVRMGSGGHRDPRVRREPMCIPGTRAQPGPGCDEVFDTGTKPYKFIGFGAMDGTKPYKFIGFGAMDGTKPYKFIGFGAMGAMKCLTLMHYTKKPYLDSEQETKKK